MSNTSSIKVKFPGVLALPHLVSFLHKKRGYWIRYSKLTPGVCVWVGGWVGWLLQDNFLVCAQCFLDKTH